jgi:hypothetical protein
MSSKRMPEDEKIKRANERWLNPKTKKPTNWSFALQNRRDEYKRIMDDNSWLKRFKGNRM